MCMGRYPQWDRIEDVEWNTHVELPFKIKYVDGYQKDVNLLAKEATETNNLLRDSYREVHSPIAVFAFPDSKWILKNGEARADGNRRAVILLAPSDHSLADADWFKKTIIHEITHILLHDDCTFDLPEWFEEGFCEFLSVTLPNEAVFKEYHCQRYRKKVVDAVADGSRELTDFTQENKWAWSYFILHFITNNFDVSTVVDLIQSDAETFEEAFASELEMSVDGFERRWIDWVSDVFSYGRRNET